MSETDDDEIVMSGDPDFPRLPRRLQSATNEELAERYIYLGEIKHAGETRVGRHPSGRNNPADVEKDAQVREVLDTGLHHVVREMAAVHHELFARPGGMRALMKRDGWAVDEVDEKPDAPPPPEP